MRMLGFIVVSIFGGRPKKAPWLSPGQPACLFRQCNFILALPRVWIPYGCP